MAGSAGSTEDDFLKYLQGRSAGFMPYAAGAKRYGPAGRSAPNIGPVDDKLGYKERDRKLKTLRNAMLKRTKAAQRGRFMSSDFLDPQGRSF